MKVAGELGYTGTMPTTTTDRLAEAHAALHMAAAALAALTADERCELEQHCPSTGIPEHDEVLHNLVEWAFNDRIVRY